jgi:hypothetical protein
MSSHGISANARATRNLSTLHLCLAVSIVGLRRKTGIMPAGVDRDNNSRPEQPSFEVFLLGPGAIRLKEKEHHE